MTNNKNFSDDVVGALRATPIRWMDRNGDLPPSQKGVARNAPTVGTLICLIIAAAFLTCTDVPDYCSRGNRYDPGKQFCFADKAYPLCSNGEYNPLTEGCNPVDNTVGTRCLDSNFVPVGTPCGGYTINTASAPANGGGITRSADGPSYAAGEQVTLVAEPASGYTFAGWAGASTETNPAVTLTMNSNQPLIAMFRPATATLATTAYPPDGGTINREVNGTQVTVTATPQEGHTFSNWEGASTSTNPSVTVTVDEGKTLVAIFKPNTYTLTVNSSPAAGGWVFVNNTASTGTKAYDVGTVLRVMAQAEDGYNFTGWSGAFTSTKADTTITINNSNQTLTANFVEKDKPVTPPNATYTLTVNAGAGGTVTPSTPQTDIKAGTRINISATANSGREFNGWTVTSGNGTIADTNRASTSVTVNGNVTVTANFKYASGTRPDGTYTLTLNREPPEGGKVFVDSVESPGTTYHPDGARVSINAEAAVGYRFTGWAGGLTSTNVSITVNMYDDLTLTAKFDSVGTRTLTINKNPANGGTVFVNNVQSSGTTTQSVGAQVTVMAEPNTGYYFSGWSGASGASTSISPTVTITMSQDRELTANFEVGTIGDTDSFRDSRDGQSYRTVLMPDGKTWMAQNLNFLRHAFGESWCYGNDDSNCEKYGRLYDWEAAMIACPSGWHLPTRQEWNNLVETAGGSSIAGSRLKSQTGWVDYSGISSTDEYGFSALPGGNRGTDGYFYYAGDFGFWWSATEGGTTDAWYRLMYCYYDGVIESSSDKSFGFSVRCVEDNAAQR